MEAAPAEQPVLGDRLVSAGALPPLFAHQRTTLDRSRDAKAFALFLEMGLGKTRIAIETALHLFDHGEIDAVLVIAPKGVYRNWSSLEIPKSLPAGLPHRIVVWTGATSQSETRRLEQALEPGGGMVWLVMNVEGFSSARAPAYAARFLRAHRAMAIVDESTSIKTPTAARTKAILALRGRAPYRRILTGSPVTKSPLDLFAPCAFLGHELLGFTSYYAFRNRYAKTEELPLARCVKCGHFPWKHADCVKTLDANDNALFAAGSCTECACSSLKQQKVNRETGYQRLDELHEKLGRFSVRATKEDCVDLPPKIYMRREVELTPVQRKVYTEMAEHARAVLESAEVSASIVLTQMLRLHQIVCGFLGSEGGNETSLPSNRMAALLETIDEAAGKVIVWATYSHDVRAISRVLAETFGADQVVTYSGATPAADRPAIVEAFQAEHGPRFFVGQPRTGGYGITLTAANTVVYYSNSFDLEIRLQSEDRAHRIGQRCAVTYVDLVTPDSVDEKILGALREKRNIASEVLGDRWKDWL